MENTKMMESTKTMENPVDEFQSLLAGSEFLFAVFYRGHWCPFCISYLTTLHSLESTISSAGGKTVIITSEEASKLPSMRTSTGYTGAAIVDPENTLATELKKRDLIDVAVSAKGGYPHGMMQPGVLVLKKDGTVLYSWAIVPGLMNIGGAKDRPDLKQVWENVDAKMHDKMPVHASYNKLSFTGVMWKKLTA